MFLAARQGAIDAGRELGEQMGCDVEIIWKTPNAEDAQAQAQRLSALGFNLVRIHHHDSPWVNPNIFGEQKFVRDTQRISLGMKQLESDPWEGAVAKYPVGARLHGAVTNITEYGAFIELEPGIEGLVHVSEMSWTKKNVHPGKIVSTSQEVDVIVLDVDLEKRRISLGLKQAQSNPWEAFAEKHPVGSTVEGEVKNATEFGLFIGLEGDVDGMVHMLSLIHI